MRSYTQVENVRIEGGGVQAHLDPSETEQAGGQRHRGSG
jgi:hypothetical protein